MGKIKDTKQYLGELLNYTILNKIVINKEHYKFLLPDSFVKSNLSEIHIYLINLFKNTDVEYCVLDSGENWFLVIN